MKIVSRRLVLAAALGGAFAAPGAARAVVETSPRFNIDGAGGNPIRQKSLHANWVLQSFGYDNVNQHIYFAQNSSADLWVTKTDTAGNQLGAMLLQGFGHGVSIGVEPYNGVVYLWTEWQASSSGFGTKIGRFPFVNGATLAVGDSSIQDRTPSIGDAMINPQPAIDPAYDRLWVRYHEDTDVTRIVGFTMDDARAGRMTIDDRKVERALPSRGTWGETNPFQGFTAYGRYAYLLEGGVSTTSYITTVDLNDDGQSTVDDRNPTTAGEALPGREPQGMAIWLTSSGPRLAFGFHSNTSGVRQASVFYKSTFV